ncbi:WD40-repeat-containing domain protein [Boletus edulis BED1]|uniref:WD40-repeat-containing domain protein n=1 Tax=Boletus edulis BED1 TaxID=1328754 RepID=A0AAD4C4H6_BOLED|nr:WD40-repeat-containing domain protein [Boletus edulis BED1]
MSSRMSRPPWNETSEDNFYTKSVEIDGREDIWSIAFLVDGRHVVSGGEEGKIRCWRVEDGKEVGLPMGAGSAVGNLAVSPDGKWIVSGTTSGQVAVWDVESHSKVSQFAAHPSWVRVVDVSPDATRIATGSKDKTACVWSLSDGQRLLGPLQHNSSVGAVKFSPDGHLLATATWWRESVRVYDTQNRSLLVDVPIKVNSALNQSLAWANDSKQLFALASDGYITSLDVFTGTTLSQWRIHNDKQARCITLAPNGTFIAASAESSYSFWDITTHRQIGPVIEHTPIVASMAISADYNVVTGGGKKIRLRNIYDLIPLTYYKNMACESAHTQDKDPSNLEKIVQDLRNDLRAKSESSNNKIMHLEQMVQQLHDELTESERKADSLIQIIRVHEQKHQCEVLYAEGHIIDAAASLLELANTISEDARANELIMNWLAEFTYRCASTLENTGNEALNALKHGKAIAAYSAALSLSQSTSSNLLIKWANTMLSCGTATGALGTAAKFKCPRFVVYRVICDVLERDDRITEGIECFRQMQDELGVDTDINGERARWESDFRRRCREKLGRLVNVAMDFQNYSDANGHFSSMLLLNPVDRVDILMKRSAARASMSSWEEALSDVDEVSFAPHIVLDSIR